MSQPWDDLLRELLPQDVPHRDRLIEKSSRHLEMIAEANEYMNLTRITTPREAVIKHIVDSVLPWRLFAASGSILDAGTGAGIPGVPLAIVLPECRFLLAESVQKKARFVETAVKELELTNVEVSPHRAEQLLRSRKVDVVTARAMAPLERAIVYFDPAFQAGARAILYKGPDVEAEMDEASATARKYKVTMRVVERYELPDEMGSRSMVEIRS